MIFGDGWTLPIGEAQSLATEKGGARKQDAAKRINKEELGKFDPTPLYFYTEKDSLNRITVLKQLGREIYLVAGRYTRFEADARVYNPLTDEEKVEVERLLRMGRKDASVSFL